MLILKKLCTKKYLLDLCLHLWYMNSQRWFYSNGAMLEQWQKRYSNSSSKYFKFNLSFLIILYINRLSGHWNGKRDSLSLLWDVLLVFYSSSFVIVSIASQMVKGAIFFLHYNFFLLRRKWKINNHIIPISFQLSVIFLHLNME